MLPEETPQRDRKQYFRNLSLAFIAGQAGCLTLVVVLIAVFGGLWLDQRMDTKPTFTLLFVLLSIPVSLIGMFVLVRSAISRIRQQENTPKENLQEDRKIGRNQDA